MRLGVGLIGSGFMGKTHAFGFLNVGHMFSLPVEPELAMLADVDAERAARAAKMLGFDRSTGNWRELVADERVGIVDITTPNTLHKEMALAAMPPGRQVTSERPRAPPGGGAPERT